MDQSKIVTASTEELLDGPAVPSSLPADTASTWESSEEPSGLVIGTPQSRKPAYGRRRYDGQVQGRVGVVEPRRDGSLPYVVQLLVTGGPLLLADLFILLSVVVCCNLIGLQWLNPDDITSRASVWLPSVAVAMVLINSVMGLYPGIRLGLVEEIRRLSLTTTIVALIVATRLRPGSNLWGDRIVYLVCAYLIAMVLAPLVRNSVRRFLAKTSWWGFPTLVCGNGTAVFGVCEWLAENRRLGLRPLGVITDPNDLEVAGDTPWYLGAWEDARALSEERHAYWSILVETHDDDQDVIATVEKHLNVVPNVFVVSELTGLPSQWNRYRMEEGLAGFHIEQHLLLPIPQLIKRVMDVTVALLASLVLTPLLVFMAIAIKLTSRGPVFYTHERVGKRNTRIQVWKFRTMVANADGLIEEYLASHPELREEWERDHKIKGDPRVTALGQFMRKWSIDELPQLWNVLRGEMSLVGPRPIVPNEIPKYAEHFQTFCTVPPGMTGLWQVCGRNDTSFDERIHLGLYYIYRWSPWMDIYLLVRTVKAVLLARGAY